MLCNRQNFAWRQDPTRLAPRLFLLARVLHLIRERYQVVPDDYHKCRLNEILEFAMLGSEILAPNCDPDLGEQPFGVGSVSIRNHETIIDRTHTFSLSSMSSCSSTVSILNDGTGEGGRRGMRRSVPTAEDPLDTTTPFPSR